jgi:prolyl oligopeptidase
MRFSFALVLFTGCALGPGTGGASSAPPPPPKPVREATVEKVHGVPVADPYRHLEDVQGVEVQAWANQQDERTRKTLETRPSRAALKSRIEQLAGIGRLRAPSVYGNRIFYSKRTALENQSVLYVRDGFTGAGRRLVDPNTLSADGTTALDWWYPSPDGSKIAYGLSEGGSEMSTLRIKEVESGKELAETIPRTRSSSVSWLPDQTGFYYTQLPAPGSVPAGEESYHRKVYFHKLGTSVDEDRHIFGEGRPKEDWPTVEVSHDGKWLTVSIFQGWSKSEIFIKDLQSDGRWMALVKGLDAMTDAKVHEGTVYLLTNWKASRFRIASCAPTETDPANWKTVVPEGDGPIRGFEIVGGKLAVHELSDAMSRLRILSLGGSAGAEVELPTKGTVGGLHADPAGSELVFEFSSFFTPAALFRYNAGTGKLKEIESLGAPIDPAAFEWSQVRVTSKDGTAVPMFVLHKKGLARDGKNPTILSGYGGFSQTMTPYFGAATITWLERGGVYAIANLRGGGEYGEPWHRAGMLEAKQNTFDDFIAAAEWLIKERVTAPDKLGIEGHSNGGLLVGAALTQRPELFRAVLCGVPLLDMVRYHKFLLARLWIPEYGNPEKPEDFAWLYAYSPYHRVKDRTPYPAVLLMTSDRDTRVDPMHAFKMCARLQEATSSGKPVLLRYEKKAGHGAGKPLSKAIDDLADQYAFMMWQLGLE